MKLRELLAMIHPDTLDSEVDITEAFAPGAQDRFMRRTMEQWQVELMEKTGRFFTARVKEANYDVKRPAGRRLSPTEIAAYQKEQEETQRAKDARIAELEKQLAAKQTAKQ